MSSVKAQRNGHACQNRAALLQCHAKVQAPTEDWLNEMTGSELHKQKNVGERGGAVTPTLCDAARWAQGRALYWANYLCKLTNGNNRAVSIISILFRAFFLEAIYPCHQLKQL